MDNIIQYERLFYCFLFICSICINFIIYFRSKNISQGHENGSWVYNEKQNSDNTVNTTNNKTDNHNHHYANYPDKETIQLLEEEIKELKKEIKQLENQNKTLNIDLEQSRLNYLNKNEAYNIEVKNNNINKYNLDIALKENEEKNLQLLESSKYKEIIDKRYNSIKQYCLNISNKKEACELFFKTLEEN